ncbi:DNA-binding MarR family transcriptional regulator [Actinoalloteichus hoggarensis]|uniref:MarR family protein n=1 Tax=Actinoalloteichus hoggarensis TaxID=1470176 RepID=A0A221W0L2_9PSEU|nr:MarR family winged helix-turn-helix transcriptional regulator [Actinoalloteichus hoggarensis]ASO19290.1 MarR family protein [Actinoalloteichus hoggarensis]MBB5920528.1 DNA-binding MarR family transcriptional regulator [Actinoalloteichus hoggarensis]
MNEHVAAVERAMVVIRRMQSRRVIGRLASEQNGVSPSTAGFEVLDAVEAAELDGRPIGVTDVASALSVDRPRASRLVSELVSAGLLRREADQRDGRRTVLTRTAEGRTASAAVHRFRQSVLAAAMSTFSSEDQADFARLLTAFAARLPTGSDS